MIMRNMENRTKKKKKRLQTGNLTYDAGKQMNLYKFLYKFLEIKIPFFS